jgi:ribosomal protein S18 acetylase RimI-like enzyme
MSDPTVEAGNSDDITAVTDLWVRLAAGQREHGSHLLPEENRSTIRESVARHAVGNTLLVARAGEIVGFAMVAVETGAFEQDCTRGIVENLYVVPERRGEGVGTALIESAEARLVDRGADVVTIEVMAENGRARELYRRVGYEAHRIELEKPARSDTHSKDRR